MSVAKSSRCLFCSFAQVARPTPAARRKFHSSPSNLQRKPKYPNVKAEDTRPVAKQPAAEAEDTRPAVSLRSLQHIPEDVLEKDYTPNQRRAIKAAQELISDDKLAQSKVRDAPWSMTYYDDFAQIDPVVDKPVRAPWTNTDQNSRLKTQDELAGDLTELLQDLPENDEGGGELWRKFDRQLRLTVGSEEAEKNPRAALMPDLPKLNVKPKTQSRNRNSPQAQEEEPSPALVRLMQMTGYGRYEIAALRVKSMISHSVTNQTRLGKIRKMYFLSVAGNGNGLIGIGEGKSDEPEEARLQSQYRAIRNMQPILRYEGRTIYGDVRGKVSATELELYARPPGFGLRCQQYIWEICKCAGISDLAARVTRARNPMNTVKATVAALLSQKDPEDIARARGKKLVDVRKVYYAGMI